MHQDRIATKALAKVDDKSLKPCSISSAEIERNGWTALVKSGVFDEQKALLSLEATKKDYLKSLKPASIDEAIKLESPSFSTLKLYRGEVKMNVVIHSIVYQIKDFFSVGRQMTDAQVEVLCDLIFQEYHWMTIAEFKLFSRKAMSAHFGKVYDRLDGDTIMQWLREFANELLEARRNHIVKKQSEERHSITSEKLPSWFTEKMDSLFERWEKEKKRASTAMQFISLDQYCTVTKTDKDSFFKDIELQAKQEYELLENDFPDLNFEQFFQWHKSKVLAEINKEWQEGKELTIED